MSPAPWLFWLLLPAGALAPGVLLGRALRAPAGPAGALLGSAAVLTNLALALDVLGLPLDSAHFAAGLALVWALLAGIAQLRPAAGTVVASGSNGNFRWTPSHWLLMPAGIGVAAVAWRAIVEPLSGFDTFFRWDFLAQEMLRTGSLRFYPAVTAGDFLHYGWCDGIAPLISTLYFWSYCSLGHVASWATAPIVVAQAAGLFWLVGQLAARHGGAAAGFAAAAVLATNAWALWGVAMGQETGFTALSVLGLLYFLDRARTDPAATGWAAWAGVAAGAGALAREYGLAFILIGLLALAWQRTPRRGWLAFSLAAGVTAAPWYVRNWARTGNPLWPHDLAGLFPTNPVQLEYYRIVGESEGLAAHPDHGLKLAMLLAIVAVPLALGVAGALSRWRERGLWLLAMALVVGLWLWSIGQTSGGLAYAMRVLAPAFAVGAVFAGLALGRGAASRRAPWLAGLLAALAVEAGVRSLFLPASPFVAWWRQRAGAWRDLAQLTAAVHADPGWQAMADAAHGEKILVTDPSNHAALVARGAKPVVLFSPEVRFLFDPGADFSACVARLRSLGFRFVVITRYNPVNDAQMLRHPFFSILKTRQPAAAAWLYFVYDLHSLAPVIGLAGAAPPHAP